MNEPLRPWEERALVAAKEGRFTAYVELHFAYMVLDHPRNLPFQKEFHALIKDKKMAVAFVEYCRKLTMGGICG
jgi:hypothetical protein